ncbi:MAG: hypothetical protein AAF202_13875, partial [Pseudomonadota bacterium]
MIVKWVLLAACFLSGSVVWSEVFVEDRVAEWSKRSPSEESLRLILSFDSPSLMAASPTPAQRKAV